MKTIKWELPFKTMHYLNSLTEQLAQNPSIILITGIQDEEGNINSCNIGLRGPVSDEALVYLGATIGAHSVGYSNKMQEAKERMMDLMGLVQNLVSQYAQEEELVTDEVIYLPEVAGSFAEEEAAKVRAEAKEEVEEAIDNVTDFIEDEVADKGAVMTVVEDDEVETVDVEDVITEIIEIKKKPDSRARLMLRKILNNFKKSK